MINTLLGGGAERVLVDVVNNLDSEKYDITVQTIFDMGLYKSQLKKNIRYKTMIKCNSQLQIKLYNHYLYIMVNAKRLYEKHFDYNYDIEVAFLEGIPKKYLLLQVILINLHGYILICTIIMDKQRCLDQYKKILNAIDVSKRYFVYRKVQRNGS